MCRPFAGTAWVRGGALCWRAMTRTASVRRDAPAQHKRNIGVIAWRTVYVHDRVARSDGRLVPRSAVLK